MVGEVLSSIDKVTEPVFVEEDGGAAGGGDSWNYTPISSHFHLIPVNPWSVKYYYFPVIHPPQINTFSVGTVFIC